VDDSFGSPALAIDAATLLAPSDDLAVLAGSSNECGYCEQLAEGNAVSRIHIPTSSTMSAVAGS
jgi:hypothetical protein